MLSRPFFIFLAALLSVILLTACSQPPLTIVGKWSGWMTVECPNGQPPAPSYRPLTISLDLQADGQCTNVHGSGIGADITSQGPYEVRDSLFLLTNGWGTDTLRIITFTDGELVLRRTPYESGCVQSITMKREAPVGKTRDHQR